MVQHSKFKNMARDAEKYLDIPEKDLISLIIQGYIRAYKAKHSDENVDVTAQFHPTSWKLNLLAKKTIVVNVENDGSEITIEDGLFIDPSSMLGDIVTVEVTDEVETAGVASYNLIRQGIVEEIKKRHGNAVSKKFNEIGYKCVTAKVVGKESKKVVLELGGLELFLPTTEQVKEEDYPKGSEFVVYVKGLVDFELKTGIVVSRVHPELVRWALRKCIAQVELGNISIKTIGRKKGKKALIALHADSSELFSKCLKKESEVAQELGGIEIQFVEWTEDLDSLIKRVVDLSESIENISVDASRKNIEVKTVESLSKKEMNDCQEMMKEFFEYTGS